MGSFEKSSSVGASTGCDASANHPADDGTYGKPDEHPTNPHWLPPYTKQKMTVSKKKPVSPQPATPAIPIPSTRNALLFGTQTWRSPSRYAMPQMLQIGIASNKVRDEDTGKIRPARI